MAKGDTQRQQQQLQTGLTTSNQQFQNNFDLASQQAGKDYSDISSRYQNLGQSSGRSAIDNAMGTFGSIATTGGFNEDAIRQRALAPTRAVFDRAISEVDRSRRLGGASPNYAAAQAKLTRDRAYGLSDASVNVEGMMEQLKAQNRLAAAQGLSNAAQSAFGMDASIPQGMANLYGTTPGMMGMTGNQLLGSQQNLIESQRTKKEPGIWSKIGGYALSAAPYIAMAASSRELKEDIQPANENKILKGLNKLELKKWKYKGDSTTHFGPIAEEFKEKLGIGDGKTLHLADVMGISLAVSKKAAKKLG